MIGRWRSGGIKMRLRKLEVDPLALDRVITSEALESWMRLAHGDYHIVQFVRKIFCETTWDGIGIKLGRPTIWETGMDMIPPICVTW